MTEFAVYRLYADDGVPLYIGQTQNLDKRLHQHRTKPWFPEVATMTVTFHDTRPHALSELRGRKRAS